MTKKTVKFIDKMPPSFIDEQIIGLQVIICLVDIDQAVIIKILQEGT